MLAKNLITRINRDLFRSGISTKGVRELANSVEFTLGTNDPFPKIIFNKETERLELQLERETQYNRLFNASSLHLSTLLFLKQEEKRVLFNTWRELINTDTLEEYSSKKFFKEYSSNPEAFETELGVILNSHDLISPYSGLTLYKESVKDLNSLRRIYVEKKWLKLDLTFGDEPPFIMELKPGVLEYLFSTSKLSVDLYYHPQGVDIKDVFLCNDRLVPNTHFTYSVISKLPNEGYIEADYLKHTTLSMTPYLNGYQDPIIILPYKLYKAYKHDKGRFSPLRKLQDLVPKIRALEEKKRIII